MKDEIERTEYLTIGADVEFLVAAPKKPKPPRPVITKSDIKKAGFAVGDDYNVAELAKTLGLDVKTSVKKMTLIADEKKIVPCVGYCPGTKAKPYRNEAKWEPGYALQEDNVMLEVNIPYCRDPGSFGKKISTVIKIAQNYMKQYDLVPVLNLSEHLFLPKDLTSPQAQNFACDPDFDAYEAGAERIAVPDFKNWRSCGGHIHLGGDFKCPDWVAVLFFELAVYQNYGQEYVCPQGAERTRWYGRPGTFRPKPYGIEYRTLGNQWCNDLHHTIDLASTLYRVGNWMIHTPSQIIQSAFRTIKWTLLHDLLLNNYGMYDKPNDVANAMRQDRISLETSVAVTRREI